MNHIAMRQGRSARHTGYVPPAGAGPGAASERLSGTPRMVTQKQGIRSLFGPAAQLQDAPAPANASAPILQRYRESEGNLKISNTRRFAVRNEGENGKLYVADDVALPDNLQHVVLHKRAEAQIDDVAMAEVEAVFTNRPAMDEMFCGKFSNSVTGVTETQENENAPVGRSLYTNNVTQDTEEDIGGWQNHYAPVIVTDGTDRGTLETAVGIDYCWFGIYGAAKGQTFRYKTQIGNIARSLRTEMVDEVTGQRILSELNKYKNDEPQDDESLHAYTLQEITKLREMALAPAQVLGPKTVSVTPEPKTKQESDAEARRSAEEFDRRQRNKTILQGVLALGAAALSVLALYWKFG